MGANAQTTVPTFTASQVLTAAEMNASARTGVPVFATTVTRDAAFGGTGEKTLAEGQMCYVEGTGLQTYNGSAWITWGAGGTWTSYTPTIKGGATTVTATINYAKYMQIGNTVTVQVNADITSTGAANGIISVTYPSGLAPASQGVFRTVGVFSVDDAGVGAIQGVAVAFNNEIRGRSGPNSGDFMGANTPAMTLANNDRIALSATYEVA